MKYFCDVIKSGSQTILIFKSVSSLLFLRAESFFLNILLYTAIFDWLFMPFSFVKLPKITLKW